MQTILLIPVPESETIVGKWRKKYDPSEIHGIPAHITLLFPFKNPQDINSVVIHQLKNLFIKVKKFSFTLSKINTFPGVIFLEPEPKDPFISLTEEIARLFPENPPYEGKFDTINPHLTIGHKFNKQVDINKVQEKIAHNIQQKLPIKAVAEEVCLMEKVDEDWLLRYHFFFY